MPIPNYKAAMQNKPTSDVEKLFDNMLGNPSEGEEKIVLLPCVNLIISENQPFRLYTEDELQDLAERIKRSGLLNAIIVRPAEQNMYEILSGRNRAKAVMINGEKEIKAIVREVDDDTAMLIMLDANLGQREKLLPSEKAKAYKMEVDILNRRGKRPDSSLTNGWSNFDARKIVSERHKESKSSITNYIRLTYLIPEIIELVDSKELQFTIGVELSYLDEESQTILLNKYIKNGIKLSKEQVAKLKDLSKLGVLNEQTMAELFEKKAEEKPPKVRSFKLNIQRFSVFSGIPDTEQEFEDFIFNLLTEYQKQSA